MIKAKCRGHCILSSNQWHKSEPDTEPKMSTQIQGMHGMQGTAAPMHIMHGILMQIHQSCHHEDKVSVLHTWDLHLQLGGTWLTYDHISR